MKACVILVLFICCIVFCQRDERNQPSLYDHSRVKRNAVGALHIVTNHAQPIHADVKPEGEVTDKPCPRGNRPSPIEPGVGFKVIPPGPEEAYVTKSLRKSLPLLSTAPSTADIVRTVSRVTTLAVLLVSAVLEFYPTLKILVALVYNFVMY